MMRLAYWTQLTWFLVDTVSGYFQNLGILLPADQTVSAVFRIFALILLCAINLNHLKGGLWVVLLVLAGFATALLHAMTGELTQSQFVSDLQQHFKLLLPVLLYRLIEIQGRRGLLSAIAVRRILAVNASVLLFNIALGVLGFGFGTYGETADGDLLGSKGFLYAGNELAISLVIVFGLVAAHFRERFKNSVVFASLAIFAFLAAAMNTFSKTAILGAVLVALFAISSSLSRTQKLKSAVAIVITALVTVHIWLPGVSNSIERWQYFYERNPELLSFLSSGRSDRVGEFGELLDVSPSVVLIGQGWLGEDARTSFENDLLDLTANSGAFGLSVFLIWIQWATRSLVRYLRFRQQSDAYSAFLLFLSIAISVIAGHVMYSAMAAPFIALCGAYRTSDERIHPLRRPLPFQRSRSLHG